MQYLLRFLALYPFPFTKINHSAVKLTLPRALHYSQKYICELEIAMDSALHGLRGKQKVDSEFVTFLDDTRIRLLETIEQHGMSSKP